MCGIAGILSLSNTQRNQLPHLVEMTREMRLRGPDDEGYFTVGLDGNVKHFLGNDSPAEVRSKYGNFLPVTSGFNNTSILAMGHRRLSILDVSASGHQPMGDANGRYWIVFNGEIYNFREIRTELESYGYRFLTSTDTEVVLAAFSCWNEDCLRRFNGDFSFAIWDLKEKCLFCARDRIGIKPFYYTFVDGQFVFGSDIKTIIASGIYRPTPDPEGLYLAMAFGIAPRPITAFKGIKSIEQSHWMRVYADGRCQTERYWHIPVGTQNLRMTEEEAVDLIEDQIQLAVRRRLTSDVPVGTFMSGGVDSTTISAIAAHQHPGIKAFTLGFQSDASELDEIPQAIATANMHPLTHIIKRIDPESVLSDLFTWVKGYEEPFYHIAANYVISKVVKENDVTVVLNGLGGDELFAGYQYYRYHGLPRIPALKNMHFLSRMVPGNKFSTLFKLLSAKSPDRLHTMLFQQTCDEQLGKLFNPVFFKQINTPDRLHNLYGAEIEFTDTVEAMCYMDLMNCVGNHHVHRVDQFTMANSIEGRFPYLDHELIEAAFRVPSHFKIKNGVHKYVLRKVAAKHIAPECLSMNKKGFGLPLAQWMKGPLKSLVIKSLKRLAERPEVCADAIKANLAAYERGFFEPTQIWHLVSLEMWFECFID